MLGTNYQWTSSHWPARSAIVIADTWKTTPFIALLILAGLQGISGDLYESAKIDGANAWQRFGRITLPLVKPALAVAVIFRALDALRMYDLPAILTGGANGTTTMSILVVEQLHQRHQLGVGAVDDHVHLHLRDRVRCWCGCSTPTSSARRAEGGEVAMTATTLNAPSRDQRRRRLAPQRKRFNWGNVGTGVRHRPHHPLVPAAVLLDGRHGLPGQRRTRIDTTLWFTPRHAGATSSTRSTRRTTRSAGRWSTA